MIVLTEEEFEIIARVMRQPGAHILVDLLIQKYINRLSYGDDMAFLEGQRSLALTLVAAANQQTGPNVDDLDPGDTTYTEDR